MSKVNEDLNLNELSFDDLKKISGGTECSDVKFNCSYVCPICGLTHTFVTKLSPHPTRAVTIDVIEQHTCSNTVHIFPNGDHTMDVDDNKGNRLSTTYNIDSYTY